MNKLSLALLLGVTAISLLAPELAFCGVESTLSNIQSTLINRILPLVGALGMVFAAFSFFSGNPNAKGHLMLAIIGAVVGFGAPSIIDFIRSLVH